MDPVFDAQYRIIKDGFARQGIDIEIAYTPGGDPDYVHQAARLLTVDRGDNIERITRILPGIQPTDEPAPGDLRLLATDTIESGPLTVPEALEALDGELGDDNPGLRGDGLPLATPNHILHIARLCPAVEPEVPSGDPSVPWPPPRPAGQPVRDVLLGVCDTGLLEDLDPGRYPWLADVDGDPDVLGQAGPDHRPRIPAYAGHGTFIAGVAKCLAPSARVFVADHFSVSGAERETEIIAKLEQLAQLSPDIINLSAGTYTRADWTSLGFATFHERYPGVTLVTAAGNDATDRPFYPAAYDWTISVGALGADRRHRAWFSNYGDWVDVYALGEGLVNAYASGTYTYREPPKRPAKQEFEGMARWDGTSFAAPMVAGLIAVRMSRTGETSAVAAQAVLAAAAAQSLDGVGPALFPGDEL